MKHLIYFSYDHREIQSRNLTEILKGKAVERIVVKEGDTDIIIIFGDGTKLGIENWSHEEGCQYFID